MSRIQLVLFIIRVAFIILKALNQNGGIEELAQEIDKVKDLA